MTRGRHDDRIALFDRQAARQRVVLAVRRDHPGGAEGGQKRLAARREAGVERRGGVARVPDGPQGIDETGSPGKVECDEFRHWPVA